MKVRLRKYEGCWNDDGKLDGVIGQHCPNVRVVSAGVKKCSFSLLFLIRHAVLFSQSLHHPNSTSSGHSHILATPTHGVLMGFFFYLKISDINRGLLRPTVLSVCVGVYPTVCGHNGQRTKPILCEVICTTAELK